MELWRLVALYETLYLLQLVRLHLLLVGEPHPQQGQPLLGVLQGLQLGHPLGLPLQGELRPPLLEQPQWHLPELAEPLQQEHPQQERPLLGEHLRLEQHPRQGRPHLQLLLVFS